MKKRWIPIVLLLAAVMLVSCGNTEEIVIHTGSSLPYPTQESTEAESTAASAAEDGDGLTVLINKNSKAFHLAFDCIYASRMSEENRLEIEVESIEYLLEHGYTPCGRCSGEYKQNDSEE